VAGAIIGSGIVGFGAARTILRLGTVARLLVGCNGIREGRPAFVSDWGGAQPHALVTPLEDP